MSQQQNRSPSVKSQTAASVRSISSSGLRGPVSFETDKKQSPEPTTRPYVPRGLVLSTDKGDLPEDLNKRRKHMVSMEEESRLYVNLNALIDARAELEKAVIALDDEKDKPRQEAKREVLNLLTKKGHLIITPENWRALKNQDQPFDMRVQLKD